MDLCKVLEENPASVFVGPDFMAFYVPPMKKVLFLPGDYRKFSEETINEIVVQTVVDYRASLAKMN